MADQRKAALDKALQKIEKNFGKGSIMRMGDAADMKIAAVRWQSTRHLVVAVIPGAG